MEYRNNEKTPRLSLIRCAVHEQSVELWGAGRAERAIRGYKKIPLSLCPSLVYLFPKRSCRALEWVRRTSQLEDLLRALRSLSVGSGLAWPWGQRWRGGRNMLWLRLWGWIRCTYLGWANENEVMSDCHCEGERLDLLCHECCSPHGTWAHLTGQSLPQHSQGSDVRRYGLVQHE